MKLFTQNNKSHTNTEDKNNPSEATNARKIEQDIYDIAFLDKSYISDGNYFDVHKFVTPDEYHCFVFVRLLCAKILINDSFLKDALSSLSTKFSEEVSQEDIFERMKSSIYSSGDVLANKLSKIEADEIDDIDFNSAFVAIKDNELYVWIDGPLNVRIYRGDESILVNEDKSKDQFWGSTILETGDIIGISTTEALLEIDENFELYVLEKEEPNYPSYYIDIQTVFDQSDRDDFDFVEEGLDDNHDLALDIKDSTYSHNNGLQTDISVTEKEGNYSSVTAGKNYVSYDNGYEPQSSKNKSRFTGVSKDSIQAIFRQKRIAEMGSHAKIVGFRIGTIINDLVSDLMDKGYGLIPGKTKSDLKAFQNSGLKLYLKFGIFILLVLVPSFLIFNSLTSSSRQEGKDSVTEENNLTTESAGISAQRIEKSVNDLDNFFQASNLQAYNTLFQTTKAEIANFRKTYPFSSELAKINSFEAKIDNNYFSLNKIQPIEKADVIYLGSKISGSEISSFDVVGDTVYAVDRVNKQILISNSSQGFDVFLTNDKFSNLNQIICLENSLCYLDDSGTGFHSFNITTKEVNTYSQLKGFSEGVIALGKYQNNFYSLVPSKEAVYRFQTSGNGTLIQIPQGKWNSSGFNSQTVDFGIDGSIFSLSSNGELVKFSSGVPETPNSTGYAVLDAVTPPLGSDVNLALTPYRDANGSVRNRFYISDSASKSIVVFSKDVSLQKYPFLGRYQYTGPDSVTFENISQISLGVNESHLFVLSNNAIFRVTVDKL